MNVDISALRAVEREKGISFDSLIETLQTALLTAYRHTDGHVAHARVDVDQKTGQIRVMARELDATGAVVEEWDDTPHDFGRIAATTARQVILQRLRDVENERTFGDFAGKEGELISGKISADARVNAKGVVVVSETPYGLVFTPSLTGIPPGLHGFHVHENGSCADGQKDGKTVARLSGIGEQTFDPEAKPKRKIDITALQEFTRSLPMATESGADLIRRMRDEGY